MYTFFAEAKSGNFFKITDSELKHLRVCRIKKGEEIGVIFEGSLYRCVLKDINRKEALCEILEKVEIELPSVKLTLFQAVPVNLKTFEFILQKATELGIESVVPVITGRSFQDLSVIKKKFERWEKIIREAMKQSRRPEELKLEEPVHISDINAEADLNILLDNFSAKKSISEISFKGIETVSYVVGPEGGFSEEEINMLVSKGFTPVKLRTFVLRTETASIVAGGIILNLAGS